MAPRGLKIGDTFDERDFGRTFRLKVVGFDGMGNYISECIGEVKDEPTAKEDLAVEELPFASTDGDVEETTDEETAEEQPVVEEPKEVKAKTAPKKKTTSKKKTTTKKK